MLLVDEKREGLHHQGVANPGVRNGSSEKHPSAFLVGIGDPHSWSCPSGSGSLTCVLD